jgi:trk system potassium uptake protein TrkH
MLKVLPSLRLLAFPVLLMGVIQLIFGFISILVFHDSVAGQFLFPGIITIFLSLALIINRNKTDLEQISYRESMLFVTLTWILCGISGAIPIQTIGQISFTDAVFESISALTTTGATVLSGLDDFPKTFLMYRQFLQWLGGLGVVIFVVALLPMLNVGGMRILKAETPGPMKNEKLAPRVAQSAQYLWYVYVVITVLCCLGFVLAGMSWFDAIAHSFSTVSTGGFSTHDASIGFFDNRWIEINADIFMLLGAISFAVHFGVFQNLSFKVYYNNEETRIFIIIVAVLSAILGGILWVDQQYPTVTDDFLKAIFHLISFMTSTGFGSGNFSEWTPTTAILLIFASYLGGCAGSTAGGTKIIRNILSFKIIRRQLNQLLHPHSIILIRFNGKSVPQNILSATTAFMTITAFISVAFTLLLMWTGLDLWSAFSAVSSCINVLGPAFGELSANFQPVSDTGTWLLSIAMLLGRLEFFTVLVIFSKLFWQK